MCLSLATTKGLRLVGPKVDVADGITLKGRKDGTCPPLGIFGILSPTLGDTDGLLPSLPQLLNNGQILTGTADKVSPFGFYATGKGIIAVNFCSKDIHIVGTWKTVLIIDYRMGYTAY